MRAAPSPPARCSASCSRARCLRRKSRRVATATGKSGHLPRHGLEVPRPSGRSHVSDDRRTCHDLGHCCASYAPGHHMHPIHARKLGESPWGWRDGVVSSVADDEVVVDYVTVNGQAVLWHHADLESILSSGTLVRVHEELHALGGTFGWLNVAVAEGLGPVPTPDDTSAWRAEMRIAITDVRSGRAVAVDHLGSPGPDAPAQ